jgi:aminopeptidase N
MWFGDLVTMRWFNDVWLKEVFANFMAARIVNPSFPAVNHELRFLFQHYPSAYDVDRTPGANPIRQPLSNLHDAGSLYGPIIYQKAPIVMRQLELVMGAEPFRDGLRQYLGNHAFGNATWLDLVTLLDERTAVDLQAWSRAWVDSEGRPRLTTQLATAAGRIERLTIEQTDPRGRPLHWPQRIRVLVDAGQPGGPRAFDVALTGASADVSGARGLPEPRWVVPVGGGLAYGDVVLPPGTLDHLAATLAGIGDAVTRGAVTVLLWESMLEGRLSASRMVDALAAALDREPDELNVGQMLEYLRAGFWRFTPADDRPALARRIEPLLSDGLARARSTSAKAAWFGALRSVATTPEMLGWLEQVWRRRTTIPGLPLSETDETDLVLDLAVRDVESADAMVIAQLGRIENADRRARFEFIQPAVSRDAATREAFFEGLKDAGNRRREAWVLEGLRYLHHPLRAASSRRLVVPSLALVWDIQRTGDIFFPKRWADATLSGYQSAQTSAEVQSFIAGLPADYPPRLKWILQSAADPLARAAR